MFARGRSFLSFYIKRTGIFFSFLFICFVLQFHSAFASPTDRWQLFEIVGTAGFPGQSNIKGYECGNAFLSDSDVKEAQSIYHHHIDQNLQNPLVNYAPPVNSNIRQHYDDANDPQEIEDFDVDQYLNLEEFDTPIENSSPQEYQSTQQRFTPIIYQGPLYSDSGSSNYILWPIQKRETFSSPTKYSSEPYYIVINKQNKEVIDVISRIKNNDFTKCIKMNGSKTELSTTAPYMNNGYQCASEFLGDTLIQKSLNLVLDNFGKFNTYPISYVGRLYPVNSGYMIWPIFSRNGLYDYDSVEAGPYFLVIDRQGNLIETVVEGLSGNFLRCPRSRKPSKLPLINAPNHPSEPVPEPVPVLVPISKSGYYCGRTFFSDKLIKEAVTAAKIADEAKISRRLPIKFDGPPLNEPVLLWPLMQNGRLYEKGSIGIYRLVLAKNYDVKAVAIMQNKRLRLCEKGMMEDEKDHEKNDNFCFDHLVTYSQLVDAAEKACSPFVEKKYKFYPARYEGPNFEKIGPYYTYPVPRRLEFAKRPGRDRVVINLKCEVVAALTTIPERYAGDRGQKLVLCAKSKEHPEKNYIEPEMPIAEHLLPDQLVLINNRASLK